MCFTVTLRSIVVATLWIAGTAVAVADIIYPPNLAALAIGLMLGGASISVRARVDRHAANWETAYEAGREVEKVRQIR